jgi:hypothetical protein
VRWKNSESKNFRGLSGLGKALHLGLGDFLNDHFEDSEGRNAKQKSFLLIFLQQTNLSHHLRYKELIEALGESRNHHFKGGAAPKQ